MYVFVIECDFFVNSDCISNCGLVLVVVDSGIH